MKLSSLDWGIAQTFTSEQQTLDSKQENYRGEEALIWW